MFDLRFLHVIRHHEIQLILKAFPPNSRILEIGGGTGAQAKALIEFGFSVESIDVEGSNYSADQVHPVHVYDGVNLPFADSEFDVVFSSNVLEHVRDLDALQKDIQRVLRPGGICVHVLPTGAWRFWSNVTHCLDHLLRVGAPAWNCLPRSPRPSEIRRILRQLAQVGLLVGRAFIPNRHGETGNALTEIWTFSRRRWIGVFKSQGFAVVQAKPMELFYTGYMVLGAKLPLARRITLSRKLGSACVLYVLTPNP